MTTYMCLASNLQLTWFWHVERAQWSPNSRVRLHSSRGNSPILRSRLKRTLIDVPAKINWSVKISAFDTWKEDSIRSTVWKIQKFTLQPNFSEKFREKTCFSTKIGIRFLVNGFHESFFKCVSKIIVFPHCATQVLVVESSTTNWRRNQKNSFCLNSIYYY